LSSLLPETVPAVTLDRQCGSSQQALQFAAQAVMSGTQNVVIAGGVENMSRVPMGAAMLPQFGTPAGQRMDQRYPGVAFSQFTGAEMMAKKYGLGRADLDQFALQSHMRAADATKDGTFKNEILPLEGVNKDDQSIPHDEDEGIRADASLDSIGAVKPIAPDSAHSAATASQICDGASALLVANDSAIREHGLMPLARIAHFHVMAGDPIIMLEAPLSATDQVLKRAGISISDIDLYEVNEAFAAVPLAWLQHMRADPDRLNVHGGAIALGHPLGASGARITTTLIYALAAHKARYGLQTICEGGGMANAMIVERL
jgi:acetyl-CoA C-acetyltransferase